MVRVRTKFNEFLIMHQTFLVRLPVALYIIAVPIEMIILELTVAVFITSVGAAPRNLHGAEHGTATIYIATLLLAPLFETVIAQVIPYELLRRVGVTRRLFYVTAMTLIFMSIHLSAGLGTMMVAGLVGGMYLANTYIIYRNKSFRVAYFVTATCHAMNNVLFLIIAALAM